MQCRSLEACPKFTQKEENILKLYHLDRAQSLCENMIADLQCNMEQEPFSAFKEWFPAGLSPHGMAYLRENKLLIPPLPANDVRTNTIVNALGIEAFKSANRCAQELLCEWNFELIRRAFFPDKVSRFQCLYALGNMADYDLWPELDLNSGVLFEIETDAAQCFDANWLRGGFDFYGESGLLNYRFSPAENARHAMNYWSGKVTNAPRMEYLVPYPVCVGKRIGELHP